jgi:hypothetical protein
MVTVCTTCSNTNKLCSLSTCVCVSHGCHNKYHYFPEQHERNGHNTESRSLRGRNCFFIWGLIRKAVHPAMHGATAPSGLWPPSKSASILLYPELAPPSLYSQNLHCILLENVLLSCSGFSTDPVLWNSPLRAFFWGGGVYFHLSFL